MIAPLLGAHLPRNAPFSFTSGKAERWKIGNPYWLRLRLQPPALDDPSYSLHADCPAGTARAGIGAVGSGFIEKSPPYRNAPGTIADGLAMRAKWNIFGSGSEKNED